MVRRVTNPCKKSATRKKVTVSKLRRSHKQKNKEEFGKERRGHGFSTRLHEQQKCRRRKIKGRFRVPDLAKKEEKSI